MEKESITQIPMAASPVQAGFPSPADDHLEDKLDLNALMVKHPAATFFVRVEGESMMGAKIFPGDLLVVDRSLTASDRKIIIALINGEFTVKRFIAKGPILRAENPSFPDIPITEDSGFQVWGVVTYIVSAT